MRHRMVIALALGAVWFGNQAASAEDYQVSLSAHEVVMPFPPGTTKDQDNPAAHKSTYTFFVVDRSTASPKLKIDWTLRASEEHVPTDHAGALEVLRGMVRDAQLIALEERVKAMELDDLNEHFRTCWAPYYHLDTQNPEAPYAIYKSTLLVERSGAFALHVELLRFA